MDGRARRDFHTTTRDRENPKNKSISQIQGNRGIEPQGTLTEKLEVPNMGKLKVEIINPEVIPIARERLTLILLELMEESTQCDYSERESKQEYEAKVI